MATALDFARTPRLVLLTALVALLGTAPVALAAPDVDPDTDIARRHYEKGRLAYEAGDYATAVDEFTHARQLVPSVALDFNIARCEDRLEHTAQAIDAYRRYLTWAPRPTDADEISARIELLQRRLDRQTPPAPPPALPMKDAAPPSDQHHALAAPVAVAATAVVVAAIGAGLLGSVDVDYQQLKTTCGGHGDCPRSSWSGLPAREYSSEALLAAAGVLAIVDVVLWVRWRHTTPRAATELGRTPASSWHF